MLYVHSLFIFIFSVLYSVLEIEIEGKDGGWAKNIPTIPSGIGILTNYHVIMNIIIILVVTYSTYILFQDIYIVIFYNILWFVIEDFCWFVLNPYFTLEKYTKEDIWWHSDQMWIYNIPFHNIVSFTILALIIFLSQNIYLFYNLVFVSILTFIVIENSYLYHKWYFKTHNKNDIKNN